MTTHIILAIAATALLLAAYIWMESMRRHTRATRSAERKRRQAQERRARERAGESPEQPRRAGRKRRL